MSQILREARGYEEIKSRQISEGERPAFHVSSRAGWMNDPNGFSLYKGEYHLFYQYHPYDAYWGPMHWGHVSTKDFIKWEYLPAAIAPDRDYDKDGCFSGSAIELEDGKQLLMYTGVLRQTQSDGSMQDLQRQCVAVGDGINYDKVMQNPVLDENSLPKGASRNDFRDPKIWKEKDGSFYCVIGSCTEDKDGQILLYRSEDGISWKFETILAKNNGRFGRMWECPDFFELDQKWVLLTSPQDMLPFGMEYHNGNGTLCLIGDYNKETKQFTEESNQAVDYGIDFYAPQTLLTSDGRRVMIAWMQNWDTSNLHQKNRAWFGQMTLPRELSVKDGRLIQKPVRELEKYRTNRVSYKNTVVSDVTHLDGIFGRRVEMEVDIRPQDTKDMYRKFAIRFAQDETSHTAISFRPHESVLKVDRKFSGSRRAAIHQRRCLVNSKDGALKLRIILDRFSVEVFVNDGENVMTLTYYTDQSADGISFFADGAVNMDIVKYDLDI